VHVCYVCCIYVQVFALTPLAVNKVFVQRLRGRTFLPSKTKLLHSLTCLVQPHEAARSNACWKSCADRVMKTDGKQGKALVDSISTPNACKNASS